MTQNTKLKQMPTKSGEWLEAECLKLARRTVGGSEIQHVTIGRLHPKGTGPNWKVADLIPQPTPLVSREVRRYPNRKSANVHPSSGVIRRIPASLDVFNPGEKAMTGPTITELDERIAMIRENINELVEQAAAPYSSLAAKTATSTVPRVPALT